MDYGKDQGKYPKSRLPPLRLLTVFREAPRGHASDRTLRRPRRRACLSPGSFEASYPEATRKMAHRARQDRERNGDIRLWRTQKVQEFHHGSVSPEQCFFFSPFPFLSFLNDWFCSGLKAGFISTRYGYHRAYFDDHIRLRQTPAPPAGQVRELRSTRHPFDLGRATLCGMGGPSSAVIRAASFPLPACEMVS